MGKEAPRIDRVATLRWPSGYFPQRAAVNGSLACGRGRGKERDGAAACAWSATPKSAYHTAEGRKPVEARASKPRLQRVYIPSNTFAFLAGNPPAGTQASCRKK